MTQLPNWVFSISVYDTAAIWLVCFLYSRIIQIQKCFFYQYSTQFINNIYNQGISILHTIRYSVNDDYILQRVFLAQALYDFCLFFDQSFQRYDIDIISYLTSPSPRHVTQGWSRVSRPSKTFYLLTYWLLHLHCKNTGIFGTVSRLINKTCFKYVPSTLCTEHPKYRNCKMLLYYLLTIHSLILASNIFKGGAIEILPAKYKVFISLGHSPYYVILTTYLSNGRPSR